MFSIKKRNILWFAFLFMVLSMFFPLASPAYLLVDWATSTIDSTGGEGSYTSIAVDSNNHVHISYYDGTNHALKYATNAAGDWATSIIDSAGNVGQFSSIAVDSNDHVHISYYDATNQELKYATNAAGNWATSTIDSAGNVGQFSSIAIDWNDHVHISYYDGTNQELKYATNAAGNWATSIIDSAGNVGQFSSIAIDWNDHVHISYYDGTNQELKYATNAAGNWATSTIDSAGNVGQFSSITIDWNDHVHISYYAFGYQVYAVGYLKYATNASGDWVTSVIGFPGGIVYSSIGVGLYSSIAVDSNNIAHISYYDGINLDLKYFSLAPGFWATSTIDSAGNVGQFSSIAIDSNNDVHVSYLDNTNGELKYAESSTVSVCPAPRSPTPASPANGVTGLSMTPTLGWSREGTTSSVQVCSDSACNNVITSASALTRSWWTVSPALNDNTQYWWRIKAGNSCGSSQWSDTWSLTTMTLSQSTAWTPTISIAPLSVNFGSVAVGGASKPRLVIIKNTGKEDFVVNSATITGVNRSEFIQAVNCAIVSAKSECYIYVTFSPVAPFGKKGGIMSISFNDPKKTTINVKLSGQAPPPKISFSRQSVNFDSVAVGTTSATKIVRVRNTGLSDLTINEITLIGTNASEFAHTSDCTTIAKGGSCTITIALSPTSANSKTATMSISSSDPRKSIVSVKLKGKGI